MDRQGETAIEIRRQKQEEMTTMTMTTTSRVVCLCPTYHARPASLVGNSIACFEAQTYQTCQNATLLVYDDTGHFEPTSGPGWNLVSDSARHPTLSAKYNWMVDMTAEGDQVDDRGRNDDDDVLVVWEDDDIYLPWHVEACVRALERPGAMWCHPSRVLSLYTGKPAEEGAAGRFHASLAFRRGSLAQVGGWPDTARGDFDQQLIRNLERKFGPAADPLAGVDGFPPSYVFRWGSTGTRHGQTFMQSGGDEGWYRRAAEQPEAAGERVVVPAMDAETRGIVAKFQSINAVNGAAAGQRCSY